MFGFTRSRVLKVWMAVIVVFPASLLADDAREYLEAAVNPRSGVPCPSPDLYSPVRADPPGVPTMVGLSLRFQDISQLNDVDQTITTDVYVFVRWRDPRLADPGRGDGSADCPVPGGELWKPAIEPENLRSRSLFYAPRFLVDQHGTITLAQRQIVQVANPLDLHDFPFDRHQFRFTLWPTFSRTDEIIFHPISRGLALNPNLSLRGWRLEPPVASVNDDSRFGREGAFSRYDVVISVTREWTYYAWKLGVPLLLIVLMAYTVYYIPPTAVAQQVAVGMTSMLTLIAYMLALSGSLPKISYLTRGDRLFVGMASLVFLGLLKGILTTVWVHRKADHVIAWSDRIGRISYPILLALIVIDALWL